MATEAGIAGYSVTVPDGHGPRLYDHHLSSERPFWARTERHVKPTALDLNLHSGMEVCIGLSGRSEISYGEAVFSIEPGDVALTAAWEPHGWRAAAPGSAHFVIVFLPELLGQEMLGDIPWLGLFASPPRRRPRAADAATRGELLTVGRRLSREVEKREMGWETVTRLYLLLVLAALRRVWRQPPAWEQRVPHPSDLARIMPALRLFHSQPVGRVGVDEAAAACSMSRSHFDALFRRTMGLPFGRFRARSRLDLAARLLLSSDLSVTQIAAETRFVDASHLHHAFLSYYGCTPNAYRTNGRLSEQE